jgi:predicted 3-demethylubiquinone-9 3-methyltransferase (glyoxalase superfamily)
MMQMTATRILPCLWFDCEAEEAAKFYASKIDIDALKRAQAA